MRLTQIITLLLATAFYSCHPVIAQTQSWKITKPSWTSTDEKNFQAFVQRLGEAVERRECTNTRSCMTSSANPYKNSDPAGLRYFSDCADFPYFLRGYFAWKNGLPFGFATGMRPRPIPGNGGDKRYSKFGNEVVSRYSTSSKNNQFPNAIRLFNELIPDQTSSANYRTNFEGNDGELFSDHYPIRLNRESIQPGTVIYDPNGHVVVIYKITDDGRIYYFDAHPDNSLTTGLFGVKFLRSNPGHGAGFKNWRPLKLVGATQDSQGNWISGKIVGEKNSNIPNYSIEQFFGTNETPTTEWQKAPFVHEGKNLSYYEYVRVMVAKGELRINPLDDLRTLITDLCQNLKDRVIAVETSLRAGIQNKPHPDRLPNNIYGTDGEWESYSTPSRDARLKVSFKDLLDQSQDYISKLKTQDPTLVYTGPNLAQDLIDTYQRESQSCQISYTNSVGRAITLNLEEVRARLFKLSFDPYHCIEYRWGATGDELRTCQDNLTKQLWYDREQRLRNQLERRYDVNMGFNLEELAEPRPENGVANPPDVDLLKFLRQNL
ncbi:MAG: hypothetical protein BroJett040_06610 [Oligoflexia bacterium]|nr:MAG: hypothetical protein BroJett040_06610 [Oligoflexia bacterium]